MKLLLTLAIPLVLATTNTFAQQSGTTVLNSRESTQLMNERTQILSELQRDMVEKFDEIEALLDQKEAARALSIAKSTLDTVRVKTGIDPKSRIQENFLVATTFPAAARSMPDLSETQRELVITTVSDFRGGLYLDIINLSKRTTLLYIKALQMVMAQNGGLTTEDKQKIFNDLVKASLIPMPIVDKKGKKIFAFDEDVANEDHTYLFNRELKMFLIGNLDLKITEDRFEERKNRMRNDLLDSLAGVARVSTTESAISSGLKCIENAYRIAYWKDQNAASISCFQKFYAKTLTMDECITLAAKILSSDAENSARKTCFNKFN